MAFRKDEMAARKDEHFLIKRGFCMIKKTKTMKALIIKSGNQPNGFYISEQEIKNIHCQKNEGKMLIDRTDYTSSVPCGYLIKTELQENKELVLFENNKIRYNS